MCRWSSARSSGAAGRSVDASHRPAREVQSDHRAVARRGELEVAFDCEAVQAVAKPVAEPVQALDLAGRVDLRQAGGSRRHRQHRVVERARVRQCIGPRRVEAAHQVGAAAEGAEREPAAEVLPEGGQIRRDADDLLEAAGREARRHHLVEDEQDVVLGGRLAQSP